MSDAIADASLPHAAPAAAASPDGVAAADFVWRLVRGGASVGVGSGLLPPALRIPAERFARAACAALAGAIERSVSAHFGAAGESLAAAFGVALSRRAGEAGLIALDLALSRALVEPISQDVAGLRGAGALTDAEHGLLEYAALAALDRLDAAGGAAQQTGWRVAGFLDAGEVAARVAAFAVGPLVLEMSVGGRAGRAGRWWDGPKVDIAAPADPDSNVACLAGGIDAPTLPVRIALAPVTLSDAEFAGLRPGDAVTLGAGATPLAARLAVLETGWSLTQGAVDRWAPGWLRVRCVGGPPRPEALVTRPAAGAVTLVPTVGVVELSATDFATMFQGGPTARDLDVPMIVELWRGAARVASGEALTIDGELAIRILERLDGGVNDGR
jgi:hypothetical protein